MPDFIVKDMMARYCPTHATVMKEHCGGGDAVVAHKPCEHGCYDCEESLLVTRLV